VTAGSGPDVVLIHGALTTLEDMRIGPMDALARKFRVLALDRPGHGKSERERLLGSAWLQAKLINEAVTKLGLDRPVIVGHSFGGLVALAYGLLFPEQTKGVVAVSAMAFPEVRLEHLLFGPRAIPLAGDVFTYTAGPFVDAALLPMIWELMFKPQPMPERFRLEFPFGLAGKPRGVQANGEDAAWLIRSLSTAAISYSTCKVPVEILAGSADLVVSPNRHSRLLALAVPKANLQVLPGLGHMVHHFATDEVVSAVERLQAG
jgi:pimeloyl-ACP methyl ester carboxylesterase